VTPHRAVTQLEAGGEGARLRPVAVRVQDPPVASPSVVAPSYLPQDYWTRRLLAAADISAIFLALVVAAAAASVRSDTPEYLLFGALTLPAWLVLFKAYGLYDRDMKRVSHTTIDDLPWLFHALLLGGLLLWAYYRVLPVKQLVLPEVVAFATVALASILLLRSLVRHLTVRVLGPERVLIVGDPQTTNLVSKLRAHPEYGLEPVGVVSQPTWLEQPSTLPVVGRLEEADLEELTGRHRIDRVIFSRTELDEEALVEVLRRCRELGLKVSVLPQLFDVMGPSVEIDVLEGVTVLGINPPVLPRSSRFLKRAVDVTVAAVLFVLLAPVMALIALAIKLDARGPVFFRQERIGKGDKRFMLVKFRTMVSDAERRTQELFAESSDPNWLKLDDDPRITRVGRLLRLSSLDELPQLWNVLKGDMSLVGPRPLVESEDALVGGWARSRLDLTPGVTGLWQVLGRTDIPFEEMVKLDYLYVTNWSLWGDIRLILRTFPVVVTRRGAN
jgi:exopolysaccharide biosynthesis polyprenyl glycosylphosphotransferase